MTPISNVKLEVGDTVLVINSYETVKALQDEKHGGWVEKMREVAIGLFNICIERCELRAYLNKTCFLY